MNKQILSIFVFCAFSYSTQAQEVKGGISDSMMQQIKQSYANTPTDKAIRNAIGNNDIRKLALNQDNLKGMDTHFSIKVSSKGITDQKSSGRCWLFTGLNVMRAKAIAKHNLGSFEFSQTYPFFFDQLEKANLFLQGIIDTSSKPMDDKMVEWLFRNPLSDGGTFTGVADIVSKYGLVPKDVMPETNSSENTSRMAGLIALKLREQGLQLRDLAAQGVKPAALEKTKTEMLSTIYRMLVLNLGVPPTEFTWTEYNAKGEPVSTETYTPLSFLKKYGDEKLIDNYVMLMNDPSREYYKCYEIDYDRHRYDGKNWTYVNLPIEDIKEMAISSLKDSTMMYFSCDVGKFLNSDYVVKVIERHVEKAKNNLKGSPIIVAGGYGVGSKENFDLLFDLAKELHAEVGASRAAVDAGFADHDRQIGQTGVTVRPKLYIACGISGQIQHIAGMQESGIIISINNDPDAPINTIADYVINGTIEEVVPKMIKYYKQNSK